VSQTQDQRKANELLVIVRRLGLASDQLTAHQQIAAAAEQKCWWRPRSTQNGRRLISTGLAYSSVMGHRNTCNYDIIIALNHKLAISLPSSCEEKLSIGLGRHELGH
jgi:hypothetical protein